MTLQLLTPIFSGDIEPVRDGWYLVARSGYIPWTMMWFSSHGWAFNEYQPQQILHPGVVLGWRGLAFDPAAAEPCDADAGWMRIVGRAGVFVPGATC